MNEIRIRSRQNNYVEQICPICRNSLARGETALASHLLKHVRKKEITEEDRRSIREGKWKTATPDNKTYGKI